MSNREEEYSAAERLFGALSRVDERLLERSEKKQKVVPFRRYGGVLVASICLCVVGGALWATGNMPYSVRNESADTTGAVQDKVAEANEQAAAAADRDTADVKTADAAEAAVEEEDAVAELADRDEGAVQDMPGEEPNLGAVKDGNEDTEYVEGAARQESALNDSVGAIDRTNSTAGSTTEKQGAMAETLSEMQAREIKPLGSYLPTTVAGGYEFESAYCVGDTENASSLSVCWKNGANEIWITVTTGDSADHGSSAVAFQNLTKEWIAEQMKPTQNKSDTDTPEGNFTVVYENGVLVKFSGRGSADSIWKMFQSIEQ